MKKQIWLDKEKTEGVYPVFEMIDGRIGIRGQFLFYMYDTKGIPVEVMVRTINEWLRRRDA